jgi:hypothetical protein
MFTSALSSGPTALPSGAARAVAIQATQCFKRAIEHRVGIGSAFDGEKVHLDLVSIHHRDAKDHSHDGLVNVGCKRRMTRVKCINRFGKVVYTSRLFTLLVLIVDKQVGEITSYSERRRLCGAAR